jgi:hypothetical protein
MPNIHKSFDIYYDASKQGLGCVLMQEGHVIAYCVSPLWKLGVSSSYTYSEDMEALFVGSQMLDIRQPQESEVYFHSE